jgi:chaperonin GroEL (HSP60 family)
MRQAGIIDAASVVKTAAHAAIHSAALALTIDVVVHRASPPEETSP